MDIPRKNGVNSRSMAVSPPMDFRLIGADRRRTTSLSSSINSSSSSSSITSINENSNSSDNSSSGRIPRFTFEEVERHDDASSCWIVIIDFVFDITKFIEVHPGGMEVMLENAGRDATSAVLDETAHSKRALQMMKHYCIGMLNDNECHDEVYQRHHQDFYISMRAHLECMKP